MALANFKVANYDSPDLASYRSHHRFLSSSIDRVASSGRILFLLAVLVEIALMAFNTDKDFSGSIVSYLSYAWGPALVFLFPLTAGLIVLCLKFSARRIPPALKSQASESLTDLEHWCDETIPLILGNQRELGAVSSKRAKELRKAHRSMLADEEATGVISFFDGPNTLRGRFKRHEGEVYSLELLSS